MEKITEIAGGAAEAAGVPEEHVESGMKVARAASKAFEDITPRQEYYLGRAVTATILKEYQPYSEPEANQYINLLGQTLALASAKPETYGGYHFLIMDTDEINAFAAPGGLILVSRGLLKCCPNETAVAAVLAHEIGHVENEHGLKAINKSRWTSLLTTTAAEAGKTLGSEEVAELTATLEGSVSDITATLVNNGYSRKFERESDKAAIRILKSTGYNPRGLQIMLREMSERLGAGSGGFGKTHPPPADRIGEIADLLRTAGPVRETAARQARFEKALGNI
jgi:predicted Zn-dependent protease